MEPGSFAIYKQTGAFPEGTIFFKELRYAATGNWGYFNSNHHEPKAPTAKVAPRLVEALIRQEIDPVTEIGRAATGFVYNELPVENCFPGGIPLSEHPDKPFWIVEAVVAASFFSQPRRDAMLKAARIS
jgi:hypothetical protein